MSYEFVASWPVEDDLMTLAEARTEAEKDLPDLLVEHNVILLGVPAWRLTDAIAVGRPASDGIVLVATTPAAPWQELARKPEAPAKTRLKGATA